MKSVLVSVLVASLMGLVLGQGARGQSEVVQHKGELLVGWGKVVTIENTKYVQEGDIHVEYGGTLIVRNATIRMLMDYEGQYGFYVRGDGKLEMTDAQIIGPYRKDVSVFDQGQLLLSHVTGDGVHPWLYGESSAVVLDSTIGLIHLADSAHLEVQRSVIQACIRIDVGAREPVTFRDLRPKHYEKLQIPEADVAGAPAFEVTLEDTSVGGWAINVTKPDVDVTIEDSELNYVTMRLANATGKVKGLRAGLQEAWDSRSLPLRGFSSRVRLKNTVLTKGWGVNLGGNQRIEVADCEIVVLTVSGETPLTLVDSVVQWFGVHGHKGSVVFSRSLLNGYVQVVDSQAVWTGDVRFSKARFEGGWDASSIRRVYAVQVIDEQGRPVASARVRVKDAWGSPSRDYIADGDGHVEIELGFTDKTCRSTWTLSLPGYATERAVTFFSATPLVLVRQPI